MVLTCWLSAWVGHFYPSSPSFALLLQFLQWLSKSGAAVRPSQPWLQSWFQPCVSGSGPVRTCGGCGWVVPVRTAPGEPGPSWPAYALTAQPSSTQHKFHSICCSCAACSGTAVLSHITSVRCVCLYNTSFFFGGTIRAYHFGLWNWQRLAIVLNFWVLWTPMINQGIKLQVNQ